MYVSSGQLLFRPSAVIEGCVFVCVFASLFVDEPHDHEAHSVLLQLTVAHLLHSSSCVRLVIIVLVESQCFWEYCMGSDDI